MRFKSHETAHQIYTKISQKIGPILDFGKVFVNDTYHPNLVSFNAEIEEGLKFLSQHGDFKNWYLPFNVCTLLDFGIQGDSDLGIITVTFEDNPEHKISSLIKFTIYHGNDNDEVTTGYFKLLEKGQFNQKEASDLTKSLGCHIGFCDTFSLKSHSFVTIFDNMSGVDLKSNKRLKIKLTKDLVKNSDFAKAFQSHYVGAWRTFVYFTRLLVDKTLFVVEDRLVAKNKKGESKSYKQDTLFRVLSVNTLRKSYIKLNPSSNIGTGGKRKPHERRRHTRTFKSDYYKNAKGRTIIIEPIWIGTTEYLDKEAGHLYKVRLDVG